MTARTHAIAAKALDSLEPAHKALAAILAIGSLLVACLGAYHGQAIVPALARIDRIEDRERLSERDRSEALARMSGVEERLKENTRVLRRIETKLDTIRK